MKDEFGMPIVGSFKEGYYWVFDTKTNKNIVGYWKEKYGRYTILQYLGKDYEDFLGKFKLKAS